MTGKMKILTICCVMLLGVLLGACTMGASSIGEGSTSSSGGVVVWLDQPASDATLPMAPFKLKAHAILPGGSISSIVFLANDMPVGTTNTSTTNGLAYGEVDWNPVAPGWYNIQARVMSGGGAALSGTARICIASPSASAGACGVIANQITPSVTPIETPSVTPTATLTETPTPGKITFILGAAPSPVYVGRCSSDLPTSVRIDAVPSDATGAIEVTLHAWMENAAGDRQELPPVAMMNDGQGKFLATVDMSGLDPKILEGKAGRLIYTASLMNEKKEFYAVSPEQSVALMPCIATSTPAPVMIKLGASPDPVYNGYCTQGEPHIAYFEGSPSDMNGILEADLRVWLENYTGWRFELMNKAMTQSGNTFTSSLDVGQVDPKLLEYRPGRLVYVMSLLNSNKQTYASSAEQSIGLVPCGGTPTLVPSVRDTLPPTINGGASSNKVYFDAKGYGCSPTSVKITANVSDPSGLQYVVMYWYWAESGNPNTAQYVQMSGSGTSYYYLFSPDHANDSFVYWFKAADVYNNISQSGSFNIQSVACVRSRKVVTVTPVPKFITAVPYRIIKTPTKVIFKPIIK